MRHRGEPSLLRAIRGPITLITLGVLFALNNFTPYGFDQTWPVLLIVFGLLSLMKRGMEPACRRLRRCSRSRRRRTLSSAAGRLSLRRTGGYAQSPYAQPPPAKGGFGASAPRPADAGQNPPPPPGDTV